MRDAMVITYYSIHAATPDYSKVRCKLHCTASYRLKRGIMEATIDALETETAVAVAFDDGEDDDDDDDDMADLFSFGSEEVASPPSKDALAKNSGASSSSPAVMSALGGGISPSVSPSLALRQDRAQSTDSFLDMLDAQGTTTTSDSHHADAATGDHDKETQDILDWLDDDDDDGDEKTGDHDAAMLFGDQDIKEDSNSNASLQTAPKQQTSTLPPSPAPLPTPTVVTLPPLFTSLAQALESSQATNSQLRQLYAQQDQQTSSLSDTQRAELWCRMVCGKTVQQLATSSLAEAFGEWHIPVPTTNNDNDAAAAAVVPTWIRQQAVVLAQQRALTTQTDSVTTADEDLTKLLLHHYYQQQQQPNNSISSSSNKKQSKDRLVPTVASVLLAAGLTPEIASVVLGQLIPNHMPLLALQPEERWDAALALHQEFYWLACYHVPLLVYHLDRYLPGWYWPVRARSAGQQNNTETNVATATVRARNLRKHGQLPPSWLLSHLAGECEGTVVLLPTALILRLWDDLLTVEKNDARFFLTLAALEQSADDLLLLTGDALTAALQSVFTLEHRTTQEWLPEWWKAARSFQSCTPESVVVKLQNAEDQAVLQAIMQRQEQAEAELTARLEAEAAAHRQAQEKKADEARSRLTRARLVAFYRKHAPDKEANIDKIMSQFEGRFETLDAKLKFKYGEGFNPAIKAKPMSKGSNKLLSTMNTGFGIRRKQEGENAGNEQGEHKEDKVSVTVSAGEVLPVMCWSKQIRRAESRKIVHDTGRAPLKFFLVDGRSEEAAQEQGKFPTAVNLSPEAMMDPDRIRENEEMFESLRGAVHIVVMGEGHSALPRLYGQKLSPKLEALMRVDESKTNICALFFVKKGFPFVSVLDGGFAAAHSWLVREGPSRNLQASAVLIDYDPEHSMFGQMEILNNASATEKAQRKMSNLLEGSLVTMTRRAQQFENLASDMESNEGMQGIRHKFFGSGGGGGKLVDAEAKVASKDEDGSNEPRFKNPFASKSKSTATEVDTVRLDAPEKSKQENSLGDASTEAPQPPGTEQDNATNPSPFRNPFGRKQAEAPPVTEARQKQDTLAPVAEVTDAASESDVSYAPPKLSPVTTSAPASSQPVPNPFSMFRQTSIGKQKEDTVNAASAASAAAEVKPASNPFKGLGAALNSSMKSTNNNPNSANASSNNASTEPKAPVIPNMLKRNPFARFGSGAGVAAKSTGTANDASQTTADKPAGGGFAGLNSFRRSTLARIRTNGSFDGDDVVVEESISFETPSTSDPSVESIAKEPNMEIAKEPNMESV